MYYGNNYEYLQDWADLEKRQRERGDSKYEKEEEKPKAIVCECGADKVYGDKATRLHHALWCAMRGDVDNEDDD